MSSQFDRDSFPVNQKLMAKIRIRSSRALYYARQLHKETFTTQAFTRCILDYYFWLEEDAAKISYWAGVANGNDRTDISKEEHKFLSDYISRLRDSLDLQNFMRSYSLLPGDVSAVDRKIFERYAQKFESSLFPIPYED